MKSTVSLTWLFPLAVFGFAAVAVEYLDVAFTSVTRWLALLALALFLLSRGALWEALRQRFAPALACLLAWGVLTTLWSEQPVLSLVKSLAMAFTAITFVSGGIYWVKSHPETPLSYLAPFLALTLFAGLPGLDDVVQNSAGVELYQGMVSNPNFLGEAAAVSLTLALYGLYRARQRGEGSAFWLIVTIILFGLLLLSGSRAAMLSAAPAAIVFAYGALPRRTVVLSAACVAFAVGAVIVLPPAVTAPLAKPLENLVTKGRHDLLFSRERAWTRSYEKAREGGLAGLGYGVSAGAPATFKLGRLTTGDYTRQKANAQLALIEETGVIGLAAFAFFLVQLFSAAAAGIRRTAGETRLQLLFAIALLAGLVLHSIFESWWTAPGSMGTAVFWATAGVVGGLLRKGRTEAQT